MSSILINYKKDLFELIKENYSELNKKISSFTAKLFDKKEDEIMVNFEEFQFYEGKRDLVVRAETSKKNIDLLKKWAEGLGKIFFESNLKNHKMLIGIKTYVIDSYWKEVELK